MKILLIEPQKRPRPHDIPGDLASMQALVGGAIQAVYPFDEPVALVCHEEGKLLDLPQNRALRHPDTGEIYDIICGTFFLCAAPPDSEHFASLTGEQLTRYTDFFRTPETFIPVGNALFCLQSELFSPKQPE